MFFSKSRHSDSGPYEASLPLRGYQASQLFEAQGMPAKEFLKRSHHPALTAALATFFKSGDANHLHFLAQNELKDSIFAGQHEPVYMEVMASALIASCGADIKDLLSSPFSTALLTNNRIVTLSNLEKNHKNLKFAAAIKAIVGDHASDMAHLKFNPYEFDFQREKGFVVLHQSTYFNSRQSFLFSTKQKTASDSEMLVTAYWTAREHFSTLSSEQKVEFYSEYLQALKTSIQDRKPLSSIIGMSAHQALTYMCAGCLSQTRPDWPDADLQAVGKLFEITSEAIQFCEDNRKEFSRAFRQHSPYEYDLILGSAIAVQIIALKKDLNNRTSQSFEAMSLLNSLTDIIPNLSVGHSGLIASLGYLQSGNRKKDLTLPIRLKGILTAATPAETTFANLTREGLLVDADLETLREFALNVRNDVRTLPEAELSTELLRKSAIDAIRAMSPVWNDADAGDLKHNMVNCLAYVCFDFDIPADTRLLASETLVATGNGDALVDIISKDARELPIDPRLKANVPDEVDSSFAEETRALRITALLDFMKSISQSQFVGLHNHHIDPATSLSVIHPADSLESAETLKRLGALASSICLDWKEKELIKNPARQALVSDLGNLLIAISADRAQFVVQGMKMNSFEPSPSYKGDWRSSTINSLQAALHLNSAVSGYLTAATPAHTRAYSCFDMRGEIQRGVGVDLGLKVQA